MVPKDRRCALYDAALSVNAVECPEESTNGDAQFLALTIREEFLAEKYIKKT